MAKPLPPLNSLRAFEVTARLGSLTKAAEELHVTQAAVSQQVKLLEQYLSVPLFERRSRSLHLTAHGQAYLPVMTETFANLYQVTNELFGQSKEQLLTIRSTLSFAQLWLAPKMTSFQQQFPHIKVRLLTSAWPSGQANNEIDLEISSGYGNWPNRQAERLTKECWQIVASPSFLSRLPSPIDVETLKQQPLITTLGHTEGWQQWFSLVGETQFEPNISLACESTSVAVAAAVSGAGLLLGRSFNLTQAIDQGLLVEAHPQVLESDVGHFLLTTPGQTSSKVSIFRSWLLQELGDL